MKKIKQVNKKLILILAIAVLGAGSLFAQTERIGVVSGFTEVTLHTAATVTLTEADCNNEIHINNDADVIAFTLPPCRNGLVVGFWDHGGAVITVNLYDGVDRIWVEAADGGAGNALESDGTIGRYIVLVGKDDTNWWALPIETLTWGIP